MTVIRYLIINSFSIKKQWEIEKHLFRCFLNAFSTKQQQFK